MSVKLHLTSRMNNRAINKHANSVACERRKIVGIYLKRLRSRVMPRNTSEKAIIYRLTHGQLFFLKAQRSTRGYQRVSKTFSLAQKRCLLMLLARVGARTDSTTHTQLRQETWQNFMHTRIGIASKICK